jgi:hypothetical protein
MVAVLAACSGSDTNRPDVRAERERVEGNPLRLPALTDASLRMASPDAVGAPAVSAESAVSTFAAAESSGAFAASYELLSRDDREAVPSRAAWVNAHAYLPRLHSYVPAAVESTGDEAIARGDASFEPALDEVRGLVAADATLELVAVREDGGWRIAYGQSRLVPRYAPESAAVDAVRQWATARQRCEAPAAELQHVTVVGSPALAERLCRAVGELRVASPRRLGNRPDPSAVLAAFGAEADVWARSLAVSAGSVSLQVVVAPIGDRWQVIGVLQN